MWDRCRRPRRTKKGQTRKRPRVAKIPRSPCRLFRSPVSAEILCQPARILQNMLFDFQLHLPRCGAFFSGLAAILEVLLLP